jgi:hypothetical protein
MAFHRRPSTDATLDHYGHQRAAYRVRDCLLVALWLIEADQHLWGESQCHHLDLWVYLTFAAI